MIFDWLKRFGNGDMRGVDGTCVGWNGPRGKGLTWRESSGANTLGRWGSIGVDIVVVDVEVGEEIVKDGES